MRNKNKQSGFSLVELSVVLAVIGLTISGALVIATKKTISDKIEETNYKMDKIEKAMDAYLALHARLPCTADGSLAKGNVDFGWENAIPTMNGVNGECDNSNQDNGGSVYYGGVPTKDLLIPDEFMFDGWGRRFSYVIDARFAHNGPDFEVSSGGADCSPTPTVSCTNPLCDDSAAGANSACFRYQTAGSITVEDAAGQNRTTEAVYVLISHGKNGFGAWPNFGGATLTAPTDTDEQQNAKSGTPFATTFVQKDETTTFDDIVRYRTKWQIMEDSGMIEDFDLCISAKEAVEIANGGTAITDVCSGIVDPSVCRGLAGQIWSWCLDM